MNRNKSDWKISFNGGIWALVERCFTLWLIFWLWLKGVLLNDWFLVMHHKSYGNQSFFYGFWNMFLFWFIPFRIYFFYIQKIILYNENAFVHCPLHKIILLIQFVIKISLWFSISMHFNVPNKWLLFRCIMTGGFTTTKTQSRSALRYLLTIYTGREWENWENE